MSDRPDRDAPDAIRNSTYAAVEAIYIEHYPAFCRLARSIVGSATTAEDIVQETALHVLAVIAERPQRQLVPGYFREAIRHAAIDWLRREKVAGSKRGLLAGPVSAAQAPTPLVEVRRRRIKETLKPIIATLPDRQREVFDLWRKGSAVEEIARRMDVSVNTVKSHLRRAKAHVRQVLAAAGVRGMGDL